MQHTCRSYEKVIDLSPSTALFLSLSLHPSLCPLPPPPAVRLWSAGSRDLAVHVSGELRHILSLLPLTLSCQSGHHPGLHRHGDRLPGLHGCHQGEQVSVAECE